VLFGSPTGLTAAGGQQFRQGAEGVAGSAEADDEFGSALASGDFDNDGASDLAVGVPRHDSPAGASVGAVIVPYGAGNGLAAAGNQQFWPGGSATNATRSRPGAPPASRLNGR
jgi:hypothetical protein